MWSNRFSQLFLVFLTMFAPISVWCVDTTVEITLPEQSKVNSSEVVLGDVAKIEAKNPLDAGLLSKLVIAQFPADQSVVHIPLSYIQARVSEALNDSHGEVVIHAPNFLTFEKNESVAKQVLATIQDKIRSDKKIPSDVEFKIEPLAGFEQLQNVVLDQYVLEPASEKGEWRGDMTFRLTPKVQDPDAKIHWFNARIHWFASTWLAKKEILFGQDLHAEDFTQERTEITQTDGQLLQSANKEELATQLSAARAKRPLHANGVLTSSFIDRKPDGLAGQHLQVVFVGESGLRISTDGALLENGSLGESVKARLQKSKKIVVGKLVSSNTMEVHL